ncbi:hypothetical protein AM500_20530 [Bacillus sp. FJAT-18017]|uniref:A24 family peptidase n=1 Tax=Bacillus sp. FJAT-18017 TaxID=1705566 RepID=UPI0006AE6743|nr:prepilin peptidase [Bacillus sp. FJAT-18017]ALC91910.1 hypothetical protein AM500_20530 [Bacillus sp. FJAT-18017]
MMIKAILLFLLLIICVVTDIRERRIYNKVLIPFLMVAFFVNAIAGGLGGIGDTVVGLLVGLAILLIPYLMGGMGAGDVKLLAVIGALMGYQFVLFSALYMAFAGGIFAFLIIFFRKGAKQRLKGIYLFLIGLLKGLNIPLYQDSETMKITYPYGVAIAVGAIIQLFQGGIMI